MKSKTLIYNKDEYKSYLLELENFQKEKEFNVSDNLYSKISNFYDVIKYYFDIHYCLEINDAIYYNEVNESYFINLINKYNNDIKIKQEHFLILLNYYNDNKLKSNSLSYLLYTRNINEALIEIYDYINNKINDINELLIKLQNINYKTINEFYNELKKILNTKPKDNPEECIIGFEYIDYDSYLEKNLNKETYQILEKYNCIEKIKLVKYPSLIGIDIIDIVCFFNTNKIVKIIDGDKIIELDNKKPTNIYYIYFTNEEITLKKIVDSFTECKNKYDIIDGDQIILQYNGREKEFVILTTSRD